MIYKPCAYRGCTAAPRCDHFWWIQIKMAGRPVERGPVGKYVHLLPPDADGRPAPTPTTREGCKPLEAVIRTWVAMGKPAPAATPTEPPAGPGGPPPAPPATIGELCDHYAKHHTAKSADKHEAGAVRRIKATYGGDPLALLLDRATVREFLDDVEEDTSAVNRNRFLSRWSHLITWARLEFGLVGDSPFFHKFRNPNGIRKAKEGRRRRRLAKREEAALVKALAAYDDGGMMLGRFYCALDLGLRRGEMLAVKREHIRTVPGIGMVVHIEWYNAKTRYERDVPVTTPRMRQFIQGRRFAPGPYVFGQADGSRLDSFRHAWVAVLIAAGLETGEWSERRTTPAGDSYQYWVRTADADLHWHDLRHECASRLAEDNVPVKRIQMLLGHTSSATTDIYINADLKDLAASMRSSHRKRA